MNVQGSNNVSATLFGASRDVARRVTAPSFAASDGAKVTISDAAKTLSAAGGSTGGGDGMQARLDAIKAKPIVQRTAEEAAFVQTHDERLAGILAQIKSNGPGGADRLSADDLSYMQKASGFVNTMGNLSSKEKALYDEAVARGDQGAAQGLRMIALGREGMQGKSVTLADGRTFDPINTELTGNSVRTMYKYLFAGNDFDPAFDALGAFLDRKQAAGASA